MKTAMFREDGALIRVEVLSDTWDGDKRTVFLKVLENVVPHASGPIPAGRLVEVTSVRDFEAYVGWELETES